MVTPSLGGGYGCVSVEETVAFFRITLHSLETLVLPPIGIHRATTQRNALVRHSLKAQAESCAIERLNFFHGFCLRYKAESSSGSPQRYPVGRDTVD